ncbi:AI-2E family transporter [Marinobacter sp. M-5]|jgi:predicted PurR-regulated permease PerM|uniref:AI-2E family transporter n=1 Tax=Marinobacter sp. M-5 TaxID=3081089 RepID=UPI00293CA3E7|nr:AI-2E family transporter [Marinobacter sp. M-5]MDV3504957.1 AI-2E family transporter [Marinobacter sp. M-5]
MEDEDRNVQSDQAEPVWKSPVKVRDAALVVLATIATVFFIDWAEAILLPLVVAVLVSYALDPLVSAFGRLRIPRAIGAGIVILSLIALAAAASIPLQREAMAMLDKIPLAAKQIERIRAQTPVGGEEDLLEKAEKAVKEIESTAKKNDEEDSDPGVTPVRIVDDSFNLRNYLMRGSSAALLLFSQLFSVVFLVFFMLSIGKLYRRKVIRLSGPSFQRMRNAARLMNDFHHQVRQFLFVMLVGALFVGIATWLAFLAIGVEEAGLWGVAAGIASGIPYLGPFLVFIGVCLAAFLQFGTVDMVLVVGLVSLVITSIQGYLMTPWMTSHVSSLNTVSIFIGLLFWGWIWGPIGLIVATPILMIVKSLCDHVVDLRPVGELLGK